MKTTVIYISILALLISFSSCSKESETQELIVQNEEVFGEWNMTSCEGGLMGANFEFEVGEIVWDFQLDDELIVNNTVTAEDMMPFIGFESGTYDYEIIIEEDTEYLYIDGFPSGIIILYDDHLDLDQGVPADGLLFGFDR